MLRLEVEVTEGIDGRHVIQRVEGPNLFATQEVRVEAVHKTRVCETGIRSAVRAVRAVP